MTKRAIAGSELPYPDTVFALPELHYPDRLNAVAVALDRASSQAGADRPAFFHRGHMISHAAIAASVHRWAAGLRRAGIGPGDRVLLRLADDPDLVAAVLAVQAIGAIAVPTYIQLKAADLRYRAEDTGAKAMIVAADLLDEWRDVGVKLGPWIATLVTPADPAGGFRDLAALMPASAAPDYADTGADDPALILYTSGSTGAPKGTVHSHRDILAGVDSYWRYCIQAGPGDVVAGPPAIPFALGFAFFIYYPLCTGSSAVLEPDKSPEAALAAVERHGATIFVAVASYYPRLLRLIRARGAMPPSLRMTLTGGEPLLPEVEAAWRETTGLALEQFLGTTELLHIFLGYRHGIDAPRRGAIGRAVPGFSVAVLDPETLAPVPTGASGLLAARGPTATVYWRKPDEQRKVVRDNWNVFQDIVTADADGFIHYVGRHDDMIVSGGFNISPVEVETVLIRHPAVIECACVGAPDPAGGRQHIVKAFVVAREPVTDADALADALRTFFRDHAPAYKCPRAFAFVDALPKTTNGKIQRSALRALG
ncbi:MAG: AMP-binding protein [Alphaproteobacteria bacterium]|nr:AMP-binding protein [Alphaproteobacteria bacterium]